MTQPKELNRRPTILTIAAVAVVIGALYLGKGLLVPLTMAVLLSFLLSPVCDWLERRGLGRFPSVMVTAILGFTLLGALAWTAAVQITSLAPKIPEYQSNVEAKLSSVNAYAVSMLRKVTRTAHVMGQKLSPVETPDDVGSSADSGDHLYAVRVVTAPSSPLEIVAGLSGSFGTVLQAIGAVAIVIVLVVFFLVQREDLRDRFIRLIGKSHVTVTTQTLEDAGMRVTNYLSMLFFMNLMFGVSIGIGLYLIGLPAILGGR
jgi:predicted PurR-regulated permease PerM